MTAVTAAVVRPLASASRPAATGPSRSMTSRQRPSVRLMPRALAAAASIWSTALCAARTSNVSSAISSSFDCLDIQGVGKVRYLPVEPSWRSIMIQAADLSEQYGDVQALDG